MNIITTTIIIDLLQTAGIAYLIGVHIATRRHLLLSKVWKNSIYGKELVSKYPTFPKPTVPQCNCERSHPKEEHDETCPARK